MFHGLSSYSLHLHALVNDGGLLFDVNIELSPRISPVNTGTFAKEKIVDFIVVHTMEVPFSYQRRSNFST